MLDKDRFREQFRQAAKAGGGSSDLRVIAWYDHGGVNFDLRTQDCAVPHLLTASRTLGEAADDVRRSSALDVRKGRGRERDIELSGEETLHVAADDVLILLEREGGRWSLDAYSCATPSAEHLAWVGKVLERIVEQEAQVVVKAAREHAEQRVIDNRM